MYFLLPLLLHRGRAFIANRQCFLGAFQSCYRLFADACRKSFEPESSITPGFFPGHCGNELDAQCGIRGKANAILVLESCNLLFSCPGL